MNTYTEIKYGLFDLTALREAKFSCTDKQSWVDLNSLKRGLDVFIEKYGTLEQDYFTLDGSYMLFPDQIDSEKMGLWSSSMSDEKGDFASNIKLNISFETTHSSSGITFLFDVPSGDHPQQLFVKWFAADGSVITHALFTVDKSIFFASKHVEKFKGLSIEFIGTKKPYRYLKLYGIDFGEVLTLSGDELVSAKILEEVSTLSSELSVNTLEFKFYSQNKEFKILGDDSKHALLTKRQWVKAIEYVDKKPIKMGTFYVDSITAETETVVAVKCIDNVGLLDDQSNYEGNVWEIGEAATVTQVAADILNQSSFTWDVEDAVRNLKIEGELKNMSRREALKNLAFACNLQIKSTREGTLFIRKAPINVENKIAYSMQADDHKIEKKDYYTKIIRNETRFLKNYTNTEIYNSELSEGVHNIECSTPMHSFEIKGGKIIKSAPFNVVVKVDKTQTVKITGKGFSENRRVASYEIAAEDGKEKELVLQDIGIISNVDLLKAIYDYYKNVYSDSGTVFLSENNIEAGDYISVKSQDGKYISGYVESLEIDLTGGFLGKLKIVGRC